MSKINEPLKLIRPCAEYLESYLEACRESYGHVHNQYILHDPDRYEEWKNTIFEDFERQERGIDLPPGFVPSVTFWLVDDTKVIGTINLRLKLNAVLLDYGGSLGCFIRVSERRKGYASRALPLALVEARKLAVTPILVTCVESNTGSLRSVLPIPCQRSESVITVADGVRTRVRKFWF